MPVVQSAKATVVAVGGDPLGARFNCQRGEIRVRNEIAAGAGLGAETREDLPVALSRCEHSRVRLGSKRLAEGDRLWQRRRVREHLRMRDDAQEAAENEL